MSEKQLSSVRNSLSFIEVGHSGICQKCSLYVPDHLHTHVNNCLSETLRYEIKYFKNSNLASLFSCCLCKLIQVSPPPLTTQCVPNNHIFCYECLSRAVNNGSSSCPVCAEVIIPHDLKKIPTVLSNILGKLDFSINEISVPKKSGSKRKLEYEKTALHEIQKPSYIKKKT